MPRSVEETMPRGRRPASRNVQTLEEELNALKAREQELKNLIRRMRNSSSEIRKLEAKLANQFAAAKWTINEIKELDASWDDQSFYNSVEPKKPTPRGRRPRSASAEA